jgi:chaperonin GroEL (HSP60 family)
LPPDRRATGFGLRIAPLISNQKVGIEIVRKAIQSPVRQIAENFGVGGSIVVGKLTDKGKQGRRIFVPFLVQRWGRI